MIILENTKKYKDTKIAIPVGIGVVQTESVKNFYNTSDADATSADIVKDKTAYGKYGKLTGTLDLDAEKEISYQDGYETGKTDGYDNGYSIGYEGGYNDGNSEGYQDGYAEGLDDGITDGRNQIIEEQSDANITANDVTKGKIGYSANNEKIIGTSEAITSIDVGTSGIKFGNSNFTEIPSYYDFSNCTDTASMFSSCSKLITVPLFDTSNVTNMSNMFYYCASLTSIPLFNTSKVKSMYNMFMSCTKLTTFPQVDTSSCDEFTGMFAYCDKLIDVPEFNWSSLSGTKYAASEIFGASYNAAKNIENIGGFKDAGKNYGKSGSYKDIVICYCPKLTYESCMNVINKVYDMNLNTINTYTPKIRFHATPYALLSADDIAIATAKGWTVQAG